jgi:hypothetical protein
MHLASLKTLGKAFLKGLPSLPPKEITKQLFCFLGRYYLTQILPLINRGIRDESVVGSELSKDADDIS